jgi:hypothetical protein
VKNSNERLQVNNWYGNWKFHRPVFLTGVLNDNFGFGQGESGVNGVVGINKHFANHLHRKVYKKSKNKITRLIVIENRWGKGRLHTHMILETPIHLSTDQYIQLLDESWLRTKGGVRTCIKSREEIFDEVGLKDYFSKEVSSQKNQKGTIKDNLMTDLVKSMMGVDVKNSYF